jgi:polyisoprenoid-binding protein YceI
MKNRALIIIFIAVFCLSTAGAFSAQAEKYEALLGTWDVETESGEYTFTFVFSMDGETLKGTFTGDSGEAEMESLSFEDNEVKFTVDIGMMVIDFSATIEGDSLEGMLSMEYGEANISGKKIK